LTTREALDFIEHLKDLGIPLVFLSGGEPLLRDDISILLTALKEAGIRTVLSTNGTLITSKTLDLLKNSGIAYVAISLHGSPATHDELTGVPGTFNKVARAIEVLKSQGIPVCLKTSVTSKTLKDVPWVLEWGLSRGVKAYYLCDLIPAGRGCGTAELGGSVGAQAWADLFGKLLNYIEKEGIFVDIGAHPSTVALLLEDIAAQDESKAEEIEKRLLTKNKVCPAGQGVIAVMPDGSITPCNFMPGLVLGNIREEPVETISAKITSFFGDSLIGEPCRSCRWGKICGGWRAKAYYMCNDAREGDPTCLLKDLHKI
jgi:radical SAM protein with 4Fe4S-binding SPASM domain